MVINFVIYALQFHLNPENDDDDDDGLISFCRSAYTANMIIPSLIAATNPVILIKFNEDLGRRVAFWRNNGQETVERTHHSVGTGQV